MATLREYFEADCALPNNVIVPYEIVASNGIESKIQMELHIAHQPGAKFWSLFVPSDVSIEEIKKILKKKEILNCKLINQPDDADIAIGSAPGLRAKDYPEKISFHDLTFTKRVFLYIDRDLSNEQRLSIEKESQAQGLKVIIRDAIYARLKSKQETPLAFISHDSRDKDEVVRELARELSKRACPVWYDEFSLEVGDSLRESIEQGLKQAKYCILVLSPNFLNNEGWGKKEFNAVFTKEIVEERDVVLPIWHNVSKKDVYEYSLSLADKVALNSKTGALSLASILSRKILSNDT